MKEVRLLSAAWYGDVPLILKFPEAWEITVIGEETIPALSQEQLQEKFNNPTGSLKP